MVARGRHAGASFCFHAPFCCWWRKSGDPVPPLGSGGVARFLYDATQTLQYEGALQIVGAEVGTTGLGTIRPGHVLALGLLIWSAAVI